MASLLYEIDALLPEDVLATAFDEAGLDLSPSDLFRLKLPQIRAAYDVLRCLAVLGGEKPVSNLSPQLIEPLNARHCLNCGGVCDFTDPIPGVIYLCPYCESSLLSREVYGLRDTKQNKVSPAAEQTEQTEQTAANATPIDSTTVAATPLSSGTDGIQHPSQHPYPLSAVFYKLLRHHRGVSLPLTCRRRVHGRLHALDLCLAVMVHTSIQRGVLAVQAATACSRKAAVAALWAALGVTVSATRASPIGGAIEKALNTASGLSLRDGPSRSPRVSVLSISRVTRAWDTARTAGADGVRSGDALGERERHLVSSLHLAAASSPSAGAGGISLLDPVADGPPGPQATTECWWSACRLSCVPFWWCLPPAQHVAATLSALSSKEQGPSAATRGDIAGLESSAERGKTALDDSTNMTIWRIAETASEFFSQRGAVQLAELTRAQREGPSSQATSHSVSVFGTGRWPCTCCLPPPGGLYNSLVDAIRALPEMDGMIAVSAWSIADGDRAAERSSAADRRATKVARKSTAAASAVQAREEAPPRSPCPRHCSLTHIALLSVVKRQVTSARLTRLDELEAILNVEEE